MILNEEIIKLAEKHFSFITEYTASGWIADTEDLLRFAQKIYQMGYNEGGYDTSIVMGDENV
jgi:hypothetical protein